MENVRTFSIRSPFYKYVHNFFPTMLFSDDAAETPAPSGGADKKLHSNAVMRKYQTVLSHHARTPTTGMSARRNAQVVSQSLSLPIAVTLSHSLSITGTIIH